MSSRFFAGDSDSDTSSSEEEELYSEHEEEEEDSNHEAEEESDDDSDSSSEDGGKTGASKFLKDEASTDESSDEDERTVVKSAKDKRLAEVEATIKIIENAEKIQDWAVISTEFDKLNRQVAKIAQSGNTPKIYVQAIVELEDLVNETQAKQKGEAAKKWNAVTTKGYNAMKQKIRKNNKDFQTEVDKYRENADDYMASDDEQEQRVVEKVKKSKAERIQDLEATIDEEGFATVGKGGKTLQYTPESILKHLRTIIESRGKKRTDHAEQVRTMELLLGVANTRYHEIRVLSVLIPTRFDMIGSSAQAYMSQEQWKAAEADFSRLLKTLASNTDYILVEDDPEIWDEEEGHPPITDGYYKVPGSIVSLAERLDDELTRSLRQIDPHTQEYIDRLTFEQSLYNDLVATQCYLESTTQRGRPGHDGDRLHRVVIRRLEHIYFKPTSVIKVNEDQAWAALPKHLESNITPAGTSDDTIGPVERLCKYLLKASDGNIKARAMLCLVFATALQDHFARARNLMLMSHLTETINTHSAETQILYNRAVVQIGLCAFRDGRVQESQSILQEICGSGRQQELLGQGFARHRYSQATPEQERQNEQRRLPFHMHVNLELLECVYLTGSMLLEVPLLAQVEYAPSLSKRVVSKTFRRMYEASERQIFQAPPETTRDHIIGAGKALAAGEWQKAIALIEKISIWQLLGEKRAPITEKLNMQIKEAGIRTYLFTNAQNYTTLSIEMLGAQFELEPAEVTKIVSQVIGSDQVAAVIDATNNAVVFNEGAALSSLQAQSIELAEKAMSLVDLNERILETRTAGMANPFQAQQQNRGRGGGRGGRGGAAAGGRIGGQTGGRRPGGQQFGGGALGAAIQA